MLFSFCDICGLQIKFAIRHVVSNKRAEMLNSISKVAADQAKAKEILDAAGSDILYRTLEEVRLWYLHNKIPSAVIKEMYGIVTFILFS